jgi:outer membrane protein assembly factor BamB
MVFLSSSNSHLYAFDLDDGTEIWNTEVQPTSGFDDRAMISTPVWDMDDDTLWMTVDTFIIARFNATTGERINHMALPYSRGGTMTPALSTPAIQRVGNDKFLYVGDGFQIDCFYISEIVDDPDLWVDRTTIRSAFFGSSSVYARYIDGSEANATTANNVNVNYTLSNPQGNETHLPIVWERWLGHQVYSSPVVSEEIGEWNDKIYFGDDVYAITCINATNGQSLSVYNTGGQVFGSACLYDGFVYMGSQDGTLYAFSERSGKIVEFTISSAANKAGEMWNNETLIIRGRLLPTPCIDEITGFGSYDTNGYANATIKLSVTKPDVTDEALEETTDHDGWFEFSYNPTEVGDYGWVVYYDGEEKPWITYLQAYGEWNSITVTSPTQVNLSLRRMKAVFLLSTSTLLSQS